MWSVWIKSPIAPQMADAPVRWAKDLAGHRYYWAHRDLDHHAGQWACVAYVRGSYRLTYFPTYMAAIHGCPDEADHAVMVMVGNESARALLWRDFDESMIPADQPAVRATRRDGGRCDLRWFASESAAYASMPAGHLPGDEFVFSFLPAHDEQSGYIELDCGWEDDEPYDPPE